MKKLVLIGYGNIARKHIEVFRALGLEITASCNRNAANNELARSEAGIPTTYTDFHEMIRKENPDGIIVCVSFWEMNTVLKAIIPYKIPVLAEKPSAVSLQEHLELVELTIKYSTPVMIGLNRRHYSVFKKAVEYAGGKDKITSVLIEWSEDPYHLMNNRKLSDPQIRRYIFGNSIHGIDLMTTLGGQVTNAHIETSNLGEPYRWIMNISGKSDYGVICNFNSSWDNPVPWRVIISAKEKRFVFSPLEKCLIQEKGSKEILEVFPDEVDVKFKAGFFEQGKLFIKQNFEEHNLKSVNNAMSMADILTKRFTI